MLRYSDMETLCTVIVDVLNNAGPRGISFVGLSMSDKVMYYPRYIGLEELNRAVSMLEFAKVLTVAGPGLTDRVALRAL